MSVRWTAADQKRNKGKETKGTFSILFGTAIAERFVIVIKPFGFDRYGAEQTGSQGVSDVLAWDGIQIRAA